ncbi:helix-turn-helix domain-containing protein, partial [Micrococcus sp. JV4]
VTYVLDNLTDPGLGAARIAKDLHVSERLLYAEMSRADIRLAQLIQSQRLRRVRDALTAPATIDVPIGVLAQQHGFVSASHFSRIFREEFGTTPRQWRNNTTPPGV